MARVSLLRVAFSALARIAPFGVYAFLLTQMTTRGAFVQITTTDTIWIQNVAYWARANKATLGVLAIVLARLGIGFTFVHV